MGDEAKEADDDSEQAAIVNNSEKVEPAMQQQQQAEPVDLMSRNSPLATPPPPPAESSSVEEESMQSGAEEKGDEVEEGREEVGGGGGGGGGYSGDDGTSYGSTLGESYLEETRKEAAVLEKESYSGYSNSVSREEGGKDSYQGGGVGSKEGYHHGVGSYMGVPNSYMGAGAGSRMAGGERERCNTGEREADHIVMSGECEVGDYPGPGYQEVQPRPVVQYQEPPRAHPGYQNPGYPPGYQAYLPHNVASLSQQHAAWHLGTR